MTSTQPSSHNKPYEGLLVVTVEQAVAAPLCSCHFAEGGARVIKIERDDGDFARKYDDVVKGESSYFVWANHSKESLTLNIKDSNDAALLHNILEEADIFIQNLAPGAISRVGFDTDELRLKHPKLITCDISGYGETGSYRDMKAYDFLVQCESGLVSINGSPEGLGRIGVSICDIGAGMNAVIGIQQALISRGISGKGTGVKVSLFDTAADWMTVPLMHAEYGGKAPVRVGLHHPSIAPYGGYETQDGQILSISIQNEREWKRFCTGVLNKSDIATDSRFDKAASRVENRHQLDGYITKEFSLLSRAELECKLKATGIAYGAVNSVEDFAKHPQLRRREVTLPDGQRAQLVASPIMKTDEPENLTFGSVPSIGQHSKSIRNEFDQTSTMKAAC